MSRDASFVYVGADPERRRHEMSTAGLRVHSQHLAIAVAACLLVVGCGGGQPTPTPASGGGAATAAGGTAPPGVGGTLGTGGTGGTPSYTQGAATASVEVGGSTYPLSGGTCKQDSTVLNLFELVMGTAADPQYLDVYVADAATPIHDGDYSGGLTLVTVQVGGTQYAIPATVTLANGLTSGSFRGTSAGNSPTEVSGTFTC
jgi:hypothetical protein